MNLDLEDQKDKKVTELAKTEVKHADGEMDEKNDGKDGDETIADVFEGSVAFIS